MEFEEKLFFKISRPLALDYSQLQSPFWFSEVSEIFQKIFEIF